MPGFRIREGEKWYGPYEADPLLRRHANGTLGADVVFEDIDSGAILTLDQFLDRAKQQRALGNRKPVAAPRKRGPGALQSKPLQRKINYPYMFGCICLMACFFPPWFTTPVAVMRTGVLVWSIVLFLRLSREIAREAAAGRAEQPPGPIA